MFVRDICTDTFGARVDVYLVHDIVKGVWTVDGEANEYQVGLRVGEWSQTVVLFLPCSIPQGEFDCLASRRMCWVCDVVFEDCWDVFLRRGGAVSMGRGGGGWVGGWDGNIRWRGSTAGARVQGVWRSSPLESNLGCS